MPRSRPGVVLFFRDLTSARRLEAMRADFVANASHELRTPLASLLGFIETLQGPARDDPEARERFLDIMRGQAQRMKRLIDDLLSLSRIEMRAHLPPDADGRLVADRPARWSKRCRRWRRSAASTIQTGCRTSPLLVLGDRDELLRVVENLIENAVKYGESGGKVDVDVPGVDAAPEGDGPRSASVRDYGPGIAPEHLPRLTERFYRVDVVAEPRKGRNRPRPRHRQAHRQPPSGPLEIDSEPGEGARFTVTFPEAGHGR